MANKIFMRRFIDAILPEGKEWEPKEDGDLDLNLDAIAANMQIVKDDMEFLSDIRNPQLTTLLTDLEKEYGVIPGTGGTEQERRDYLSALKSDQNIDATDNDLQDALDLAGFSVVVTQNDPLINPVLISNDILANGDNVPIKPGVPELRDYWNGIFFVGGAQTVNGDAGIDWTAGVSAADKVWNSVTYGKVNGVGLFVAISEGGTSIMTSPDGKIWTVRICPNANLYTSVAYGNGVFVAVSDTGAANRAMTSVDGVTWVAQVTNNYTWQSICFGNGKFVAVSNSGNVDAAMTSPDGVTWTLQTVASINHWHGVTFGGGQFVAVSETGALDRAMTSPDGVTWTAQVTPNNNNYQEITYGEIYGAGLFVAVANTGALDRVMTSPDGVTWTAQVTPNGTYVDVTYGDGLFVAVNNSGGIGATILTSSNGTTWTNRSIPAANTFQAIAFGDGTFVVTGNTAGVANQVIYSENDFAIANANVDADRESEFKTLILKYKPLHSWADLVVTYV